MRIADYLHIQRRFLRSAHLERDLHDPSAPSACVRCRQTNLRFDPFTFTMPERADTPEAANLTCHALPPYSTPGQEFCLFVSSAGKFVCRFNERPAVAGPKTE